MVNMQSKANSELPSWGTTQPERWEAPHWFILYIPSIVSTSGLVLICLIWLMCQRKRVATNDNSECVGFSRWPQFAYCYVLKQVQLLRMFALDVSFVMVLVSELESFGVNCQGCIPLAHSIFMPMLMTNIYPLQVWKQGWAVDDCSLVRMKYSGCH